MKEGNRNGRNGRNERGWWKLKFEVDSHKENQKSEELTSDVSVSVKERRYLIIVRFLPTPQKREWGVNYPRGTNTKERRRLPTNNNGGGRRRTKRTQDMNII